MTRRFEDVGEVFSKGIEKCRLTQLMHMGNLFTARFFPKGSSAGNTYISITMKSYWVMIALYISEISFLKLIDFY
jgi:Cft2 family RNA processing exonuclease